MNLWEMERELDKAIKRIARLECERDEARKAYLMLFDRVGSAASILNDSSYIQDRPEWRKKGAS